MDLTANSRYNLSGVGANRMPMQSRSKPVRLKALMQESDEDEDDVDENEEKPCESEDSKEMDSDEPQPLSQNNSTEDLLYEPSSPDKDNSLIKADRFSKITCQAPKVNSEINIKQTEISCVNNKEESKVDSASSKSHLSVGELDKLETYNYKHEKRTHECHNNTFPLKSHQIDVHNSSMNVALPPPSLSIYKGDYNTKSDRNKNLQPNNSIQSYNENTCSMSISDVLNKRREEHVYDASAENKVLLGKIGEYLSNLNKEDHRYKEDESYKTLSSVSETANCVPQTSGNSVHCISYNSQYSVTKYQANEKYTPAKSTCTPSLSETGRTMINRLVSETPMKHHLQAGAMHPNPSMSHKQLFQTPQNKSTSNDLSKNHVQTPSTILSTWHHNMRHTPVDGKSLISKDHVQASRNTIYTPKEIVEKSEPPRYFALDAKNVRRPLTDALLTNNDPLAYPLESKPLLLHPRSEAKGVMFESQQEDRSRRPVGLSDVRSVQPEAPNDLIKSARTIDEMKENKQSNMFDRLPGSDRKIVSNKNENKETMIGTDTGMKVMQSTASRTCNREDNVASSAECKNSREHCSVRERQQEELREIVDKVARVQFTVPSSIPRQQQGKTLLVKDKEYLILGSLGRGMSGEVLRVQDLTSGELRAIKCVNLSKMDKESAQGCLDEIFMLRKLQAPCIVTMFDYQIKESMVYVVMEMGDTDLSRLLKSMSQEKQIPLTMILYYWTEMLTAVKHIHDNGVIHSDLKPGNFLLVRGRLKLIDFGIASNINSDMTSVLKSNPVGTLNYISPEALMDIGGNADSPTHNVKYKISFKSDVWSLGCILYSLVYGHTPFHHIRAQWAKVNAITNPKPNISFPATTFSTNKSSQDCERAPPVLIDVMRKCLQHDPKARPTVSQLLQVQYVPTTQTAAPISVPADISANVLVKIKHALNEEEWRQLLQVLDTKRHCT